jgi:hypothetical protein
MFSDIPGETFPPSAFPDSGDWLLWKPESLASLSLRSVLLLNFEVDKSLADVESDSDKVQQC